MKLMISSNIDFLPPINIDIKEKINSQEYRDEVYRLIEADG